MDKKTRNPPDSDGDLPPAYDDSSNQPYNPRYSPQPSHSSTEEAPLTDSSTMALYPSLEQIQQQQQQQQQRQYHYNHQQPRHHTIIITTTPSSQDERTALLNRVSETERHFPLAALFFIFGWFFPPLWFLGACCCAGSMNRYENWWGKLNFIMAMATLISSIIYSIIVLSTGHWVFLS
ncbi:hypothetical protein BC941DRAFT_417542 [Chlamydoabsidia padenii]|nr:hypothetical protein BC941DRAFT_417542 [Chlamydoabsidia padenii]